MIVSAKNIHGASLAVQSSSNGVHTWRWSETAGHRRKRTKTGLELRIGLPAGAWGCGASEIVEAHGSSTVARYDIVEAMAVCWTAERVLALSAIRLVRDSRGLRMEIVR